MIRSLKHSETLHIFRVILTYVQNYLGVPWSDQHCEGMNQGKGLIGRHPTLGLLISVHQPESGDKRLIRAPQTAL